MVGGWARSECEAENLGDIDDNSSTCDLDPPGADDVNSARWREDNRIEPNQLEEHEISSQHGILPRTPLDLPSRSVPTYRYYPPATSVNRLQQQT